MIDALTPRSRSRRARGVPRVALDSEAILAAYRRWAGIYDTAFGLVSRAARRRAVALVNQLPGRRVLEVGVGTGLALPHYAAEKRVTGIDLSADMLARARRRVEIQSLTTVEALVEMNAEAMAFPDQSFDIAVAMFVASVVPHPRRLLAEMRRVVRPGGNLLFINHFAAEAGPRWWIEWALAPASRALGWHPDFAMDAFLSAEDRAQAVIRPAPPAGLFTLVQLVR
ncbi:MAG TPA: class I SAM-dependent methyltransferase [Acetobacteraceae bacterium]|jgi:phosphatidylethanolamine/phosphatidyl-N-methylethanolamine N-methyltransferase|nr:class I SAM-dependent methyltransferase [Acetobacteraceae bacterium]